MAAAPTTLGLGTALPVTGSFAIPLVALGSALAINTAMTRVNCNTWQGEKSITKDGKEPAGIKSPDGSVFGTKGLFGNAIDNNRNSYDPLLIATRVHANLMENLPITLLLAGLAELNGADRKKLTSVLALFTLMRVSHVFALYKCNQPARAFGFFGTNIVQLGLVGWLGTLTKGYWGY
ncbi:hypothetical protein LTR09_004005 [Extremus antarcticus]|uniref:Uncharacterized protein n=1 Tax=Extremus antarcticus TaxID=702011 RepID=A0AAJ0DIR3_9PEZI|nr:hypothetical protein LTR09_004005 [Extremus antarcticus]